MAKRFSELGIKQQDDRKIFNQLLCTQKSTRPSTKRGIFVYNHYPLY